MLVDKPAVTILPSCWITAASAKSSSKPSAVLTLPPVPKAASGEPGEGIVVKDHENEAPSVFPAGSFASVVTIAVYLVLCSNGEFGVKVATLLVASYVTVPATVTVEALTTLTKRNEVSLIVEAFMASLKVTVSAVFTATAVALSAGDADTMAGLVVSGLSATCLLSQEIAAKPIRTNKDITANCLFMPVPFHGSS
jgi:hypothetical protein